MVLGLASHFHHTAVISRPGFVTDVQLENIFQVNIYLNGSVTTYFPQLFLFSKYRSSQQCQLQDNCNVIFHVDQDSASDKLKGEKSSHSWMNRTPGLTRRVKLASGEVVVMPVIFSVRSLTSILTALRQEVVNFSGTCVSQRIIARKVLLGRGRG